MLSRFFIFAAICCAFLHSSWAASEFESDDITLLMLRVDFSDATGAPVVQGEIASVLADTDQRIRDFSYNQASVTSTVSSEVYRMPSSLESYATSGDSQQLQADARALAAADYVIEDYDVIGVYFSNTHHISGNRLNYYGLSTIPDDSPVFPLSLWINGVHDVHLLTHELLHSYTATHANYWDPTQAVSGDYDQATQSSLEYGDIFDVMGTGREAYSYMNPFHTNRLGWMPDSKITEVVTEGVYRIYAFDQPSALSHDRLALRIPISGDVYYWVGTRSQYTSDTEYELEDMAFVVAEGLHGGNKTDLLDMTPGSSYIPYPDREDAGLPVGSSFYVSDGRFTLQTIAAGGTSPNQWIDVAVKYDSELVMSGVTMSVYEQQPVVYLQVERQALGATAVSVDYQTQDGTATAGLDYTSTSGTLSWADGDLEPKTIAVPILLDSLDESAETFDLVLENPTGALLIEGRNTTTVTIKDLDSIIDGHVYSLTSNPLVSMAGMDLNSDEAKNTTMYIYANQAKRQWYVDYEYSGHLVISQEMADEGVDRIATYNHYEFERVLGDGDQDKNMFKYSGYWEQETGVPNVAMNLTTGNVALFKGMSFGEAEDSYGDIGALDLHLHSNLKFESGDTIAWLGKGSMDIGKGLDGLNTPDIRRSTWDFIDYIGTTHFRYSSDDYPNPMAFEHGAIETITDESRDPYWIASARDFGAIQTSGLTNLFVDEFTDSLTLDRKLKVGQAGYGALLVGGGGMLELKDDLIFGEAAEESGAMAMGNGVGALSVVGSVKVGGHGLGGVYIADGSQLDLTSTDSSLLFGVNAGGRGSAHVAGSGSLVRVGGGIEVGASGHGILNVKDSAHVSAGNVDVYSGLVAGYYAGSTAKIVVNDASLDAAYYLELGSLGVATMHVKRGGVVDSYYGQIGRGIESASRLTLEGSSSEYNGFRLDVSTGLTATEGGLATLELLSEAVVSLSDRVIIWSRGKLVGSGSVNTPIVQMQGTLEPGYNGSGRLGFSHNLQMLDGSITNVTIGGTVPEVDFGTIVVGENVYYRGTLNVSLLTGYVPQAGDRYTLVSAGSYIGEFDVINLPELSDGLVWDYSELSVNGSIRVGFSDAEVASVVHYGFDTDYVDDSPNANHAQLIDADGDVSIDGNAPFGEGSIKLPDGVDSIRLTTSVEFAANDTWTISFHAKTAQDSATIGFDLNPDTGVDPHDGSTLYYDSHFRVDTLNERVELTVQGTLYQWYAPNMTTGWNHYCIVARPEGIDSDTVEGEDQLAMYVNGVQLPAFDDVTGITSTAFRVRDIGASRGVLDSFAGEFDELWIFDFALSPTEQKWLGLRNSPLAPSSHFVDADSPALFEEQDGQSWSTAYSTLERALEEGHAYDQFYIADGVYYPYNEDPGAVDEVAQQHYFKLLNGQRLIGGFAGGGSSAHDPTIYQTVISADIDQNDTNLDGNFIAEFRNDVVGANAHHLFKAVGQGGVRLEGLIMTAADIHLPTQDVYDFKGTALYFEDSVVELDQCILVGNDARNAPLYFHNSTVTLTDTQVLQSNAWYSAVVLNASGSELLIRNCLFEGNRGWNGGAIRNLGSTSTIEIHGSEFKDNVAKYSRGGAIHSSDGTLKIVNSLFHGNSILENDNLELHGGAIYTSGSATLAVYHSTFAYNTAVDEGGAIYAAGTVPIELSNTVAWGNVGLGGSESALVTAVSPMIESSMIENLDLTAYGAGNLASADPLFLNVENGDYRVATSSPLIDAGNVDLVILDTLDWNDEGDTDDMLPDFAGATRMIGTTVDIGAFESQNLGRLAEWRIRYELSLDGSEDYLDLAGDGLAAFTKYAHNMGDPRMSSARYLDLSQPGHGGLPVLTEDKGDLVYSIVRLNDPNIRYELWFSRDLIEWFEFESLGAVLLGKTNESIDGSDYYMQHFRFDPSAEGALFFQVETSPFEQP